MASWKLLSEAKVTEELFILKYITDAILVGIALFLTQLAKSKLKVSDLRASYPSYSISKNKIELSPSVDMKKLLSEVAEYYNMFDVNTIDR